MGKVLVFLMEKLGLTDYFDRQFSSLRKQHNDILHGQKRIKDSIQVGTSNIIGLVKWLEIGKGIGKGKIGKVEEIGKGKVKVIGKIGKEQVKAKELVMRSVSEKIEQIEGAIMPMAIMELLKTHEAMSFSDLVKALETTKPTLSKHLKDLLNSGRIEFSKQGRNTFYKVVGIKNTVERST